MLAKFILFSWWPRVEDNSQLLMINEIIFAAVLVMLFNLFLGARQGRLSHQMNRLVSLVHVCRETTGSHAGPTANCSTGLPAPVTYR